MESPRLGLVLCCLSLFRSWALEPEPHGSPGLCLLSLRPGTEPRLNSWLLPGGGGGLVRREDNTLESRGGQGKREVKLEERARAGARAECRERKRERREPGQEEEGTEQAAADAAEYVIVPGVVLLWPIDRGPGRCIIYRGGPGVGSEGRTPSPDTTKMKRAAQPHAATDPDEAYSSRKRAHQLCCFTRAPGLCRAAAQQTLELGVCVCVCGGGAGARGGEPVLFLCLILGLAASARDRVLGRSGETVCSHRAPSLRSRSPK